MPDCLLFNEALQRRRYPGFLRAAAQYGREHRHMFQAAVDTNHEFAERG